MSLPFIDNRRHDKITIPQQNPYVKGQIVPGPQEVDFCGQEALCLSAVNRNTAIALIGLAIAAVLLGFVWIKGQQQGAQIIPSPTPVAQPTPTPLENSVEAEDQEAADSAVVASATLSEGGYVVIHRSTEDGKPGQVIGNTDYLGPGTYQNLEVALTGEVEEGEELFAMLHGDDGDQEYGFPDEDLPLQDEQGNIILVKFSVTGSAMLEQ